MDDKLMTTADVEISGILHFAQDKENQYKVVKRLLDGNVVIQTIGDPVQKYDIAFYAMRDSRDILNTICSNATEFKLVYHNHVYVGIIEEEEIVWNFIRYSSGRDWAEGRFTFIVTEVVS